MIEFLVHWSFLQSCDHSSHICAAQKQHICLNKRSDSNICNTCSHTDPTRSERDTGNSERWVTFHTPSNIAAQAGCGEKNPTGPFKKDNRSASLRTPSPPHLHPKGPRMWQCVLAFGDDLTLSLWVNSENFHLQASVSLDSKKVRWLIQSRGAN